MMPLTTLSTVVLSNDLISNRSTSSLMLRHRPNLIRFQFNICASAKAIGSLPC